MTVASRLALQASVVPSLSQNHHRFPRSYIISSPTTSKKSPRISCSISISSAAATTTSIPWGCEVDSLENAEALQKWLSASGLPPQKMKIERVEVGERGLVALKNIRKGEKLLFVPPSLVITADSCFRVSKEYLIALASAVSDTDVRLEHPCFLGSELAFHTCCIEPVLDGDHHTKESKEDEEVKEVQKVAKEIKGIQTMVRNLLSQAQDILPSSSGNCRFLCTF